VLAPRWIAQHGAAERRRLGPEENDVTLLDSRRTKLLCSTVLLAFCGVSVGAPGESDCTATGNEIASLMEKTKVGAVMDYVGSPSEYESDGDPDTLEIVFLSKRKGVSSSVSDDGEVIFLVGKVKDAEQQRLIMLAFCRKAVARRT